MKHCPLCEKTVTKFHRRSHLLPEWMYADIYDQKHKLINITLNRRHINKKQRGHYDSIICEECELQSQVYDRYGSLILTNRSPEAPEAISIAVVNRAMPISTQQQQHYSHWKNIDFHKFQKFVFACVLRAHLAEIKKGGFLLVEKHFQKIRDLYNQSCCTDDTSYPICLVKFHNPDSSKNSIYLPFKNKSDGHTVIEFAGGGFMFRIFVSSHKKDSHVTEVMLKGCGSMYMLHFSLQEVGTYKAMFPALVELAKQFPNP